MRTPERSFIAAAGVAALLAASAPARANQQTEPPETPAKSGGDNGAPTPSGAPMPAATPPASQIEARPTEARSEDAPPSWFARAPLKVAVGHGAETWSLTFFGFVEADYIFDSTRSYNDAIGATVVARDDTYAGRAGRSQFSMRNTRLGMMFESPRLAGIAPSAILEGDFFGHPSTESVSSEAAFYASPVFRLRHAYLKLESEIVDVLAGQTYDVFGWQNYFSPCSAEFLGLPNQLFSRNVQLRVSRTLRPSSSFSVDVAVSAVRPAQRDSGVPDGNAGLRFNVDAWKGITTPGNIGTAALPLSIGLSGTVRQFKVNAFTPPPTQNSNSATGWGVSADALIPIIPARDAGDRGNRLTLTGSFVVGSGIADLLTTGGGASFPTLLNPAQANPPPLYHGDIDNGLVSFDLQGVLHTMDWQAFKVGIQYYLPPTGRVILSANFTQSHSKNMGNLFLKGGREIELLGRIADTSTYADVNVFWDATPAVRLGLSGQYTTVKYLKYQLDENEPHNFRGMAQALYAF